MFDWTAEFETIVLDRDVRLCNVGDNIYADWFMVELDVESKYMCLKRANGASLKHIRFESMDVTPSIYDSSRRTAYGYQDYDW